MRKIFIISLLSLFVFTEGCSSFGEKVISGSLKKQKVSYEDDLLVQGSMQALELSVKKLTVQGSAILGNTNGVESIIEGDLLVQGKLEAQNVTIKGKATVQGDAEISNSKINKDLIIKEHGELTDTEVIGDIHVKSRKITVSKGVVVHGNIIFDNEKGTVVIKGKGISLKKGIINGEHVKDGGAEGGSGPLEF